MDHSLKTEVKQSISLLKFGHINPISTFMAAYHSRETISRQGVEEGRPVFRPAFRPHLLKAHHLYSPTLKTNSAARDPLGNKPPFNHSLTSMTKVDTKNLETQTNSLQQTLLTKKETHLSRNTHPTKTMKKFTQIACSAERFNLLTL